MDPRRIAPVSGDSPSHHNAFNAACNLIEASVDHVAGHFEGFAITSHAARPGFWHDNDNCLVIPRPPCGYTRNHHGTQMRMSLGRPHNHSSGSKFGLRYYQPDPSDDPSNGTLNLGRSYRSGQGRAEGYATNSG